MDAELSLLAEPLRAWVEARGWKTLRPIQKEAIAALLAEPFGDADFLLSASTASGKTEAALLPLLTYVHRRSEQPRPSFEILYLSPLKALINEMVERAGELAGCVNRRAYRRHGDVSGTERAEMEARSRGVLLTTPESLEAQFIRSPDKLAFVFADLQAVIVDEVHAYFESPRGPQVMSLLARLEEALAAERGRPDLRIPRIGLSATLGGEDGETGRAVRSFLRPESPERVRILCPETVSNPVEVHLRVFLEPAKPREAKRETPSLLPLEKDGGGPGGWLEISPVLQGISRSLFDVFAGLQKGLIFTNSRREAEELAELLNRRAREKGLVLDPRKLTPDPNTKSRHPPELDAEFLPETRLFWPHHGSLDAWLRSRAEKTMRDERQKSILVCTTTLELGIDVGTVEATAQVGPGFSVASLRQRLGRSGRREGMIPTLHACVREPAPGEETSPVERLHLPTFRTLAQIHLLERGVFEPPDLQRLNLSTLIQQLLSCVRQHQEEEGLDPAAARELLVGRGPFRSAGEAFQPLVDRLSRKLNPLLQEQGGRLFLTDAGRRTVEHFTFYAAFATPQEYTIRAGSRRIGSFAPRYPYGPGDHFLFAGTYWEVIKADPARRILEVNRASGGRAPFFEGEALAPSHPVVTEMRRLYGSTGGILPPRTRVNSEARKVVDEGRKAYRELFTEHARAIAYGTSDTLLFPWVGTRKQITLVSALKWMGLSAATLDVAVIVRGESRDRLLDRLQRFLADPLPGAHDLARYGSSLAFEKHDYLLSPGA